MHQKKEIAEVSARRVHRDPAGELSQWIKLSLEKQKGTLLFAGVGNVLRSDDGAGVYVAAGIRKGERIGGLPVEMCIENYIGRINSMAPGVLIITDACDFREPPGYFSLVNPSSLRAITSNTHNISLGNLTRLFSMPVFILGIQPVSVSFGETLSTPVNDAVHTIINIINQFDQ